MEDYKEKYEQLIKRIKHFHETVSPDWKRIIESYVPELKESKVPDEESKKWILDYLYDGMRKSDEQFKGQFKAAIAWLEKQGEQKPTDKVEPESYFYCKYGDTIPLCSDCKRNRINSPFKREEITTWYIPSKTTKQCLNYIACFEKQSEQSNEKLEPMFDFKVGQWIVAAGKCVFLITKIDGFNVTLVDTNGDESVFDVGSLDDAHLWTIQDAKDGDVLYMNNGLSDCVFIYESYRNGIIHKYASYNKFGFEDCHYLVLNDGYAYPATKEQRESLFQKMKEAGYEWNTEKKELKKIEQTLTWSEEDEQMLQRANSAFEYACFDSKSMILWLKSLKERLKGE